MKIHYLNCGTMRPRLARWFVPEMARVPCLCLLIEAAEGLVLVDTGLGTRDMADLSRLGSSNALLNARPDPEQPAVRQVERLGFEPGDVRDIICTHLDRDHAGGLSDFPHARVHVSPEERDAALNPGGHREKDCYRKCHFAHGPRWETGQGWEDEWLGLDCRELPGLPPEIFLVSLPGHTRGHCGVAVDTGAGRLLHCGDTYYAGAELGEGKKVSAGLRGFRRVAHVDHPRAMRTLVRIREILEQGDGKIKSIAAHDQSACRELCGGPFA